MAGPKITIDADLSRVTKNFQKVFKDVEKAAPKKLGMGFNFEEVKKWKSSNVDSIS